MISILSEEVIAEAQRTERVQNARLRQSDGATVEATVVERREQARLEARRTLVGDEVRPQAGTKGDPGSAESTLSLSHPRAMIDRVPPAMGRSADE